MTLEEKIGQLLIVHFNGEAINEDAKTLIQDIHAGGIIYYNWSNSLSSPEQVSNLSRDLQTLASQNRYPLPLFITIDQEGGIVTRLTKGFTVFPGNCALGRTRNPLLAEQAAFAMGQELQSVGINFNFSPVVDISNTPNNPIYFRSFGSSQGLVTSFARHMIQGYHNAGVMISLKHFPGLGELHIDPHQDLPILSKSLDQLEALEFVPFAQLASIADSIMTTHVFVPSIDPLHCITLSKASINILRNTFHFKGLLITDSLNMDGILKYCSIDEAAIQAICAGNDLIILGGKQLNGPNKDFELTIRDVKRIHHSLIESVKNHRIPESRINDAVQRILHLKNQILTAKMFRRFTIEPHSLLAKKIAQLALEITVKSPFSLSRKKIVIFAPDLLKEAILASSFLFNKPTVYFFHGLNPNHQEILDAKKLTKESQAIIFCSYNACENTYQKKMISILLKKKKPFALVVLKNPFDAKLFPQADLIITTFGPSLPSIETAFESLSKTH